MIRALLLTGALASGLVACSSSSGAPTTAAPATTTSQSTTTTTATAPAPATTTAPDVPSSATATTAPASGVGAYLEGSGYTFTGAEVDCLTDRVGPDANASLAAAVADGTEPNQAAGIALIQALAACEPQSYLDSQVEAVQSQSTVTDDEALCVVRAVNGLVVDEPTMASLAAAGTSTKDWPTGEKDKLRIVIVTCVTPAQAEVIIES
jgi:hypothetical protein